jgi:general secretion pathway protein D
LKDGESVVIGGLIQDEDRMTVQKVRGLGDIPVLGELFKSTTRDVVTTDVILAITPHIVRGLEMPGPDDQAFWSGTEEAYALKQLYGETPGKAGLSGSALAPTVQPASAVTPPAGAAPRPPMSAILLISPPDRTVLVGQETRLDILVNNVEDLAEGTLTVTYDPKVLEFRQAFDGEFLKRDGNALVETAANPETGTVVMRLKRTESAKGVSGAGVLATLAFVGKGSGSSPVTIQSPRLLSPAKAPLAATGGQGTVRVQ